MIPRQSLTRYIRSLPPGEAQTCLLLLSLYDPFPIPEFDLYLAAMKPDEAKAALSYLARYTSDLLAGELGESQMVRLGRCEACEDEL